MVVGGVLRLWSVVVVEGNWWWLFKFKWIFVTKATIIYREINLHYVPHDSGLKKIALPILIANLDNF